MMHIDPLSGTLWLSTGELGRYYQRDRRTIWRWTRNGLIVQLGFVIKHAPSFDPRYHKSFTHIGIPMNHNEYQAILAAVSAIS